ncbi:MAG: GlsB/YeaQ/YmgE family stress response membrane protein, partial [Zetaproteobacteria bacterium]
LIGAVVGALAKFLMPGADPGGFFVTAVLGMVGALAATFLGRFVGLYGPGQGAGFLASIVGAVLVLVIYRSAKKRQG